jgi:copper chaperone NosL
MLYKSQRSSIFVWLLFLAFLLNGCDQQRQPETIATIQPITHGDECFICGMNIKQFPGPKGQAILRHGSKPLKFCSTNELFGWLLQPDTPGVLHSAYVHDMSKAISWQTPNDEYYIEVRKAWYVIGHNKKGAMGGMGASLASFAKKQDAEKFREESGGKLIGYSDIDISKLTSP